jgi:A/G-specific adenine glycosylase
VKAQSLLQDGEPFLHVLTHKDLHLHPVAVELPSIALRTDGAWFAGDELHRLGLPAPVRKLLQD